MLVTQSTYCKHADNPQFILSLSCSTVACNCFHKTSLIYLLSSLSDYSPKVSAFTTHFSFYTIFFLFTPVYICFRHYFLFWLFCFFFPRHRHQTNRLCTTHTFILFVQPYVNFTIVIRDYTSAFCLVVYVLCIRVYVYMDVCNNFVRSFAIASSRRLLFDNFTMSLCSVHICLTALKNIVNEF